VKLDHAGFSSGEGRNHDEDDNKTGGADNPSQQPEFVMPGRSGVWVTAALSIHAVSAGIVQPEANLQTNLELVNSAIGDPATDL
jgi:hypothetical protein